MKRCVGFALRPSALVSLPCPTWSSPVSQSNIENLEHSSRIAKSPHSHMTRREFPFACQLADGVTPWKVNISQGTSAANGCVRDMLKCSWRFEWTQMLLQNLNDHFIKFNWVDFLIQKDSVQITVNYNINTIFNCFILFVTKKCFPHFFILHFYQLPKFSLYILNFHNLT